MQEFIISLVNNYGLLGVFIITFLAHTILPIPYEIAVILASFSINPYLLLGVILVGGTLGSMTNYYLGYKGNRRFIKQKKSKYYNKSQSLFDKYGDLSILFFSWMPLIGDPLMVIAGFFKMRFSKFLIYTTIGKLFYFILIIWFGITLGNLI